MSGTPRPAWQGSQRRAGLPGDWHRLRAQAIKRASGRCEYVSPRTSLRCKREATDADHKGHRDDHYTLQALCHTHHQMKTQREAATAHAAKYTRSRLRKPEQHPGIRGAAPGVAPTRRRGAHRGVPPAAFREDR